MSKPMKYGLRAILAIIVICALVVAGYVAYVMVTYHRLPDNYDLEVENNSTQGLAVGESYSALTYNIGFGAYTPDFTFFMDTGKTKEGVETCGTESHAESEESVLNCTEGDIATMTAADADFYLLQEVDTDSTRSFHVNQKAAIEEAFPNMASVYAVNCHSAFLMYPVLDPIGSINTGLLTLSSAKVSGAVRYQYPIAQNFPDKYFDLDRCFSVSRIAVQGGKELVLINSHMSAYDEGGTYRKKQLEKINSFIEDEANKGNYVICGGDFNHALFDSTGIYPSAYADPDWICELDESEITDTAYFVKPSNLAEVPTCRNNDEPYEKGHTYTATVDGFIVSNNVKATAETIDNEFAYSDHNPVKLTFTLLDD